MLRRLGIDECHLKSPCGIELPSYPKEGFWSTGGVSKSIGAPFGAIRCSCVPPTALLSIDGNNVQSLPELFAARP